MNKIKTFFFGTHQFAVTILEGLLDDPSIEVVKVITQPDKPVGRKQELQAPPIKVFAEANGIPVEQPATLKNYQFSIINFQLIVVAQYGKLIPKYILEAPQYGTINVHTSLLPKYRGASPIQSAILNGETETGVTIMLMDVGLDTGPILLQKSTPIGEHETYLDLDKRLAEIGKEALLGAIPKLVSGEIQPTPQDDAQATHCTLFSREDGRVDWSKTTQEIYNQYRALHPWPGVWTLWGEKRVKLLELYPASEKIESGKVHIEHTDTLLIGTKDGSVTVKKIQVEGKPAMDAKAFMQGYKTIDGAVLE